jgi:hypothetical protein
MPYLGRQGKSDGYEAAGVGVNAVKKSHYTHLMLPTLKLPSIRVFVDLKYLDVNFKIKLGERKVEI